MSGPEGTTPIAYHDDAEIHNRNNGGDSSVQIILQIVQPDRVEESAILEL